MNLHNVYAHGQQVAGLDEAGKLDVLSRLTAFSNTDAGKTQIVVQAGDTLRSIAQRIYGNGNLWYVIAEANALEDDSDLVAGATLTAPEVKTSSNDASTFKPYNPSEITGPTSPGLPYIEPPSDSGCGTLGMIIMVVVAVVVSVVTFGAAAPAMAAALGTVGSAIAAGAIAGAASALASGAVGSALGVASFSWRNVAAGAVTGAITAGIGSQFGSVGNALSSGAGGWGKAAALAVANSAAGYVGQKIAGVNASFSWRGIAAGAVGSIASSKLSLEMGFAPSSGTPAGSGDFMSDVGNGMVGGVVGLHTRRAFGFKDDINYGVIAADAFGNALGNVAVRGIQNANTLKSLSPEQRENYDGMVENGIPKSDALKYARQTPAALPGYLLRQDVNDFDLATEAGLSGAVDLIMQRNADNEWIAGLSASDTLSTDMPAEWWRMGLRPSELVRDQMENLTIGASEEGTYQDKLRIDKNIQAQIAAVRAQGAEEGWDDRALTLKLNEHIVTNYAAFGLRNPNFGWMLVGGFMAHQVRAEYLNTWDVIDQIRSDSELAGPAANVLAQLVAADGEAEFNHTLINAQLAVYQDVFSQAVFYEKYGAAASLAMAQQLPAQNGFQRDQSVQAFANLRRADQLQAAGDIAGMRQAQIDAAGNLGYREQNLLQMILWNNPKVSSAAQISDFLVSNPWAQQGPLKQMARPLSIFVGVPDATRNGFFISPPALPNQNAAVESNRQKIAVHAFGHMRNLVSQPKPLAQVMRYFSQLTIPSNLYQTYADVARVDQWRGGP
jgi:hypothetical protein